jgi:hypothetical protein
VQVQVRQGDPPKDYVVHSFHANTGTTDVALSDWQALSDAFMTQWSISTTPWGYYNGRQITVNAYDLKDAKPRPEKAHSVYVPGSWETSTLGPRQVAICGSMYSGRNLKSMRGRVYLGPWNANLQNERPAAQIMTNVNAQLKALATRILALPIAWQLCIYSPKLGQLNPVTNLWCNDVWDTQRRRAPKETTRALATV